MVDVTGVPARGSRRRGGWWQLARRWRHRARRALRRLLDASAGTRPRDDGAAAASAEPAEGPDGTADRPVTPERFGAGPRRAPILAFGAYVIVAVVHLVALAASLDLLAHVTKPLLMPALALALLVLTGGARRSWVKGTLVALFFGWLGDVALMNPAPAWFFVGLGCFLVGHVAYVVVFWPRDRISGFLRRPWPALPYLVWLIAMIAVLAPYLGPKVVVLAVYGLVLGTMAALALGVNRTTAIGAALFLVSDSMLALGSFVPWFRPPYGDVWAMLTYVLGQGLIVLGLVRASRGTVRPAPGVRPSAGRVVG